MAQDTFLLVKISSPKEIDFREEHINIINEFGYVDFARVGKRKINMERFDDLIFIKESLINGGKLYKAKLSNQVGEPHSPNYYKTINIEKATFIRIESLEEVNLSDVDKDYCAISGKSIRDVIKASVPCFYIRRR